MGEIYAVPHSADQLNVFNNVDGHRYHVVVDVSESLVGDFFLPQLWPNYTFIEFVVECLMRCNVDFSCVGKYFDYE